MWYIALALGLVLVGTIGLVLASRRPVDVGPVGGRLRPCPPRPNCVCSQSEDDEHRIDPLRFSASPETAMNKLADLIEQEPLAELERRDDDYLHSVWRSPTLGFRDDVEFLLDRSANVIHVRSAARVGYSDLGANARRVESIRERLR